MRSLPYALLAVTGWTLLLGAAIGQERSQSTPERRVLVELYTSQGCDMCPDAERLLGAVAAADPRVIPIAFHVDYFNDPWKDPFSDRLHSERQAAYNALYPGPKPPEYGLYYTPMVMVDGYRSENGRNRAGIQAAVREARARRPTVGLTADLDLKQDHRSGELRVTVSPRSPGVKGRELLVCAILRDDRVVTLVPSGENAGKTLTARYPARLTRFEFTTLDGTKDATLRFRFRLEPAWKPDELGLVVFAQDRSSGEVCQATFVPWEPSGVEPRTRHAATVRRPGR
jgi:hypothetical protein